MSSADSPPVTRLMRADDLRALRGIGDERVREGRLLRPCIQYGSRPRGPGGGPGQAALVEHPFDLIGQQEQGRHRGRVVGLVLGRVLQGHPQREEVGYVPPARGDLARPARRRPGTSARSRARRPSRGPSAGRSSRRRTRRPAPAGRPRRWSRRPRPATRDRRPGRGAPASPRRSRSRCGSARRYPPAGSGRGAGWLPGADSTTVGSDSHGARLATAANFAENSPKLRCWECSRISPNVAASQNALVPPLPSTTT